jgi:hypothetical protein
MDIRLFTHAIDLAFVNSWLENKCHANELGLPKYTIMDFLHFKAYIAEALIMANKTLMLLKKRGRPSSSPTPPPQFPIPATPKSSRPEVQPPAKKSSLPRCKGIITCHKLVNLACNYLGQFRIRGLFHTFLVIT